MSEYCDICHGEDGLTIPAEYEFNGKRLCEDCMDEELAVVKQCTRIQSVDGSAWDNNTINALCKKT